MTTATAIGWESVTDVACPNCQHGIVRWAEAGYVPGWRECDVCGRQYMGDPTTGQLDPRRGPTHRCTAKRVAEVQAARQRATSAQLHRASGLARQAGERDAMTGSYHGTDWHAFSGYYETGEADRPRNGRHGPLATAYWDAWRSNADPRAVAVADSLPPSMILPGEGRGCYGLHFRPRVVAVSRDGTRVVIYRDGAGGTYQQSLAEALAGKVCNQ